jgi:hypothetical protein
MICEKCNEEMTTVTCEACGQEIYALGSFCYLCGHRLGEGKASPELPPDHGDTSDSIDFSTRVLCSDGACIGVVGEDGKCKVCGKSYVPGS